ncbi:MAG: ACP S-malonyltransferase [Patescibacteria group bacterium]
MPGLALLFAGQGAQYPGMGRDLCRNHRAARETFAEASDCLGLDLAALCFAADGEEIGRTVNAQPAIYTLAMAQYRVLVEEYGAAPAVMAGHSLGEYAALAAAGSLGFAEALALVAARARLMQEASGPDQAMAAVRGLDAGSVEEECRACAGSEVAVPACYNAPLQTVIAGHRTALARAGGSLVRLGGEITPLKVSGAFHSPLMRRAAQEFGKILAQTAFKRPRTRVLANLDALPYADPDLIGDKLRLQMTRPVRWREAMDDLVRHGVDLAIELGPGAVLAGLLRANTDSIRALAYDRDGLREIGNLLGATGKDVTTCGSAEATES